MSLFDPSGWGRSAAARHLPIAQAEDVERVLGVLSQFHPAVNLRPITISDAAASVTSRLDRFHRLVFQNYPNDDSFR